MLKLMTPQRLQASSPKDIATIFLKGENYFINYTITIGSFYVSKLFLLSYLYFIIYCLMHI